MTSNKLTAGIIEFGTKAQTLSALARELKSARVLLSISFSVKEFQQQTEAILLDIVSQFSEAVIIRSSALSEDSLTGSNAGHYTSLLNVSTKDKVSLKKAILEVIDSYDDKKLENEVLIQPMLDNISCAGVCFSSDLDTLSPYYIVNYDEGGSTDSITNGTSNKHKTYVYFKNSPFPPEDKYTAELVPCIKELEALFAYPFLDVEFAFSGGELYVFQVRPIASIQKENLSHYKVDKLLHKIYRKLQKLNSSHPNLLGNKTLFGIMPDWNPAEIIGTKPKKLGLTLYKELITDSTWAYQRDNYGYRALRSHPLLVSLLGIPFIDMRVDFNSFIPKQLDEGIATKLVNYYLDRLESQPNYHDKIEFNIVFSCNHFNLDNELGKLKESHFNKEEILRIKKSLQFITNQIISPNDGLYKKDLDKIEKLRTRYNEIIGSSLSDIEQIYWLTEDCKRYGTLPFAGIARAAFIAMQFLRSMIESGIISEDDYECFMASLNTVSKQLNSDLQGLGDSINKQGFLDKYGHLRPGTYDILSSRYDESFEAYFGDVSSQKVSSKESQAWEPSDKQKKVIELFLEKNNIHISTDDLLVFLKQAIEGREYSKLIFTRSLSQILSIIEKLGSRFDIPKEDLAFVDFRELKKLYSELDHRDVKEIFEENICLNKEYYNYTKVIKLPALITRPEEVYGFYINNETPNFISHKQVESDIVLEENLRDQDLAGKIIFIESADPGYDFLFSKNIAGLITQYGGANSHMAIRCAELGIPAVIGAGENNFSNWSQYQRLRLDCSSKQVITIR